MRSAFEGMAENGTADHAREGHADGGELRADDVSGGARDTQVLKSRIAERVVAQAFASPESSTYLNLAASYLVGHPTSTMQSARSNSHRLMERDSFLNSVAQIAERTGAGIHSRLDARRRILLGEYRREITSTRTNADGSQTVERRSSTPTGAEVLRAADAIDKATGFDDERSTRKHAERSAIDALIKNVVGSGSG
ncbi:hypothetical protein [uncultured Mediterranean phage uvDeep-CGR2-KM21-C88]|nr:hypothetical protein [uncultured Mediterranean phage uvDeep-CGR2-KM21-C88]